MSTLASSNYFSMAHLVRGLRLLPLWCWLIFAILLALLTPVFSVLSSLFVSNEKDTWAHLIDTVLLEYISNSLLLVLGVSIGVLVLGVSSAWFIARFEFIGRRALEWLLVLGFSY